MYRGFQTRFHIGVVALALSGLVSHASAAAFNSGSTGADGTFAPTQDTAVVVPASGVFNFTTVNIPSGVTVTFKKNAANSPVVILATGNVIIAGSIDVSGAAAQSFKAGLAASMDGAFGGPGGYDGGRGGDPGGGHGAAGQGPGQGFGGNATAANCGGQPQGGGGAGYATFGEWGYCYRGGFRGNDIHGNPGVIYGSNTMLPILGGSGGGGGAGAMAGNGSFGGAGGGGGGALLIAASGSVQISGSIKAKGGAGAAFADSCGYWPGAAMGGGGGGGGSGGAVRILTSAYIPGGTIDVSGGAAGCRNNGYWGGGDGAVGRMSIEVMRGGTLNFTGLPSLMITQIAGLNVPANPSGLGDVSIPLNQQNPVNVNIAAINVPLATTVTVTVTPTYAGVPTSATSSPLAGSFENSTASASVNIPNGPSVIIAQVSYTLTLAMGNALSIYAQGERVERVILSAAPSGPTTVKLVTVSGREFDAPASVLAFVTSA